MNGKRILVGVTGHRSLRREDEEQLKSKVREVLCDLKKKYAGAELFVMASMAEGADLLCYKAAREENLKVVAALPMEVDELRRDFAESEKCWQGLFDEATSTAEEIFVVPQAEYKTESAEERIGLSEERDFARIALSGASGRRNGHCDEKAKESENIVTRDYFYRQASIYVATHADVLIALWDGKPGTPAGCGTAETVDWFLNGLSGEDTLCNRDTTLTSNKTMAGESEKQNNNNSPNDAFYWIQVVRAERS